MAAASEGNDELLKFFLYAKHVQGGLFCLELNANKKEKKITIFTKSFSEDIANLCNQYIGEFLRINEFVKW